MSDCSFLVALLPHWMQVCAPYSHVPVTYLVLVAGMLTFRELTVGRLRQLTTLLALTALLIAIFGIGRFVLTGEEYWLIGLNNLVATIGLAVLLVFFMVPSLSRRYTLIANRRVMLAGAIIFGVEALLTNIVRPLGYQIYAIWGATSHSPSYPVARLCRHAEGVRQRAPPVSIENELAIARQLQFATLRQRHPNSATSASRPSTSR